MDGCDLTPIVDGGYALPGGHPFKVDGIVRKQLHADMRWPVDCIVGQDIDVSKQTPQNDIGRFFELKHFQGRGAGWCRKELIEFRKLRWRQFLV
jgi:hypothetical protein